MSLEGVANRTGMLLIVVLFFAAMTWMITWGEIEANYDAVNSGLEPTAGLYFVIGSFRDHANARKLRNQYRVLTPSVLAARLEDATLYRVVVGPFVKTNEQTVQKTIYQAGITDSWAIQVKPGDWQMAMVDPPAMAPVASSR